MNITMKYKSSTKTGEEEEHILKVDEEGHKSEELKAFFKSYIMIIIKEHEGQRRLARTWIVWGRWRR